MLQADVAADGGEYAVCKSLNPVLPGFQGEAARWDCAGRLNRALWSKDMVFWETCLSLTVTQLRDRIRVDRLAGVRRVRRGATEVGDGGQQPAEPQLS